MAMIAEYGSLAGPEGAAVGFLVGLAASRNALLSALTATRVLRCHYASPIRPTVKKTNFGIAARRR